MLGSNRVKERIQELVTEAPEVSKQDFHAYLAWATSVQSAVYLVCPSNTDPYHAQIERIVGDRAAPHLFKISQVAALLTRLLQEIDRGLLTSIENHAIAGTFEDFLDHGADYLKHGKKDEAAVIAGVVFEDTIRRICRLKEATANIQKNVPLDKLFTDLEKADVLTGPETRRARAAAALRNSAAHADWGQIKPGDVDAVIQFTRELMAAHLE
jgi:hypothetical protein